MVDITPAIPGNRSMIDSYGDGGFGLNGELIKGNLLVGLTTHEALSSASLDEAGVDALIAQIKAFKDPIEVLLIGCGEELIFLPEALRQKFRDANVSVDLMNTGAACRTFNILMTEERRAAAALIAVE